MMIGARFDRFDFNSHDLITDARRSYEGDTVSPRADIIWQPQPQHSFYASYSKNFAPYGGRGLLSVSVSDTAVYDEKPPYSRQYELGTKSDWLDDNQSRQVSVYNLELYNIRYRPDPVNDPFLWAVRAKERSRGIEASLTGRLAESWYPRSGIGYLEAIIAEDVVSPASEGRYKQGTARTTGSAFIRYVPTETPWYAEGGVTYRGAVYNDLANTSERPSYARWNAFVGRCPLPWVVTAAVTNLVDKRYWRSTSMPGAPRSFLVSANYLFQ